MLNFEDLYNLLQHKEFERPSNEPLYIWVTGLPGSGKTFVVSNLAEILQSKGSVDTFCDGHELLLQVKSDPSEKYHIPMSEGFLVTNQILFDAVFNILIERIMSFDRGYLLIELARGSDPQKQLDLSYRYLNRVLPEEIWGKSILVYLSCPYETRVKRNSQRSLNGKNQRTLPLAFEKFFKEDDFDNWSVTINAPIFRLKN